MNVICLQEKTFVQGTSKPIEMLLFTLSFLNFHFSATSNLFQILLYSYLPAIYYVDNMSKFTISCNL